MEDGLSEGVEQTEVKSEVTLPSMTKDEECSARFTIGCDAPDTDSAVESDFPESDATDPLMGSDCQGSQEFQDLGGNQDVRDLKQAQPGPPAPLASVPASVSSPALQLHGTVAMLPATMLVSGPCHGDGRMVAVPVVVQSPAGLIHSPSAAALGSTGHIAAAYNPLGLSESKASCISDSCSLILPPGRFVALDQKSETNSALLPICRICHMPEDDKEILISPCRCAGSLKFIHNTCLMVSM